MQEIDVEKIMQEIREDIKSKGYNADMLGFHELSMIPNKDYNYKYEELIRLGYQMDEQRNVLWLRELPGNPLVVFVKKVIRVLISFIIAPMSDEQNRFNRSTTEVVCQFMGYINEQNQKMEKMEKEILRLQERIAFLIESKGE